MVTYLKLGIAFCLFLNSPAYAGRPCGSCYKPYVAPAVVAPQPITQNNVYYTYQFTTPAVPYSLSGSTLYQAQGLDRSLLLDQSRRLAESATALTQSAIAGHSQLTYEALSLDAQQQLASDDVLLLREVRTLVQELRANRQGAGPIPLQALASPLQQLFNNRCASCHSGAAPKGGLDLTNADALDIGTLKKCNAMIRGGKMPKDGPLSAEEKSIWCDEYVTRLEAAQQ